MDQYIYETKCRRCGKIREWEYSPDGSLLNKQESFSSFIRSNSNTPLLGRCGTCESYTIQDLVSIE